MSSSFTWLDYSEEARRKMLDAIDLLRQKETRDELGIAGVRDAFADMLFPGTSTIQTRARYFLFIPWIYRSLERKRVGSAQIAAEARKEESSLIRPLAKSEDSVGNIGVSAGMKLRRLPSNIYWQGLRTWGILLFPGSQSQYHRSLDSYYETCGRNARTYDGEPLDEGVMPNWHAGLPSSPPEWPEQASFRLTRPEAEYLRERILTRVPDTLLAFLADRGRRTETLGFPWEHPQLEEFPDKVHEQLYHARNFSEAIHGAPLLYNLMLAEAREHDGLTEGYREWLAEWAEVLEERRGEISLWRRDEFWRIVVSEGHRVAPGARMFIDQWLDVALTSDSAVGIADNEEARRLISKRELDLKGELARLHNQSALEMWNEASGIYQLDYRWGNAQVIVADVLRGLQEDDEDA